LFKLINYNKNTLCGRPRSRVTPPQQNVQNIKICYGFDVGRSVHHHTIQINQPIRCNSFTSLLLHVYVSLNMFRAPPRPSSGVYNCINSLWFYRWSVVVAALLVVVWPDHDFQKQLLNIKRVFSLQRLPEVLLILRRCDQKYKLVFKLSYSCRISVKLAPRRSLDKCSNTRLH